MLLSLFIVSVFILITSEVAEDKQGKKKRNMGLRDFYRRNK